MLDVLFRVAFLEEAIDTAPVIRRDLWLLFGILDQVLEVVALKDGSHLLDKDFHCLFARHTLQVIPGRVQKVVLRREDARHLAVYVAITTLLSV